jgi:hypothetical protein
MLEVEQLYLYRSFDATEGIYTCICIEVFFYLYRSFDATEGIILLVM